ncbi:MAG TPA: HAD family phosphatase [Verrucomicrobiae bacterium]|nr:HAD family phosphatase [Verrucomicrobiae bacterium]
MNGIDAVIFDLGNVLLAFDERRAVERLAARTGRTPQQISDYARTTPYVTELALGKVTKLRFFHTVAKDLAFDGTYQEFALLWSDIFTPIDPMIALAESLKNRLPRLLLSNTNAIHMDYVFEHYPFLQDFDAHVLSHEVGLLKPDPAIFQHALRTSGLTAARTVFLDDIAANAEAARHAGMQGIHYQNPDQARAELTKLGVSPI